MNGTGSVSVARIVDGRVMAYSYDTPDPATAARVEACQGPGKVRSIRVAFSPGERIDPEAAKARALVALPDGRLARLAYCPAARGAHPIGTRARVVLQSGSYLSVDPARLQLVQDISP